MIKRDDLIKVINNILGEEILQKAVQKDELANGVQLLGDEDVKKVCLGVSLNEEFLKKANEEGSNFCIFHHGFDTRAYKSKYSISSQKRLKIIFQNGMSILGFHYCLDAHPEFGNNATIINKLGASIYEPFFDEWGYTGLFSEPQDVKDLQAKCEKMFNHPILAVLNGPSKIRKIGVVSGAAQPYSEEILEMEEKGVELFISGETSESAPERMRESGINYFVGGHYATEVFGILKLGNKIKEQFGKGLEVEFIDVPNII